MISLKGTDGIKNLHLPKRCDICGKKRKTNCGSECVRCAVWPEGKAAYFIMKYIRFSIRKYLYGEILKPIIIP